MALKSQARSPRSSASSPAGQITNIQPSEELSKAQKSDRAQRILQSEANFIHSVEFESRGADKGIGDARKIAHTLKAGRLKAPQDVPPHLAHLWKIALLKPDEEQRLFRQMNFLKYRANVLRSRLNPGRPNVRLMDRIEKDLDDARQLRDHIIQANLRLVVSIARRFVTDFTSLEELMSDGNLILMKAVDRFDYSRGFRFSTYATHAVQRDLFRNYKSGRRRQVTEIATDPIVPFGSVVAPDDEQQINDVQTVSELKKIMEDSLNPREKRIVDLRFGLNSDDGGQTLREVGEELSISKERVRQLQTRTIEQVRELALHEFRDF